MGAPVQPHFDFDGFRARTAVPDPTGVDAAFDGSDTAADTNWSQDVDTAFRVRTVIKQTEAGMTNNSNTETEFIVQYHNDANAAGTWDDVGAVGGGTEDVDFVAATGFADGAATAKLLGSGTNDPGEGMESAGGTGTTSFSEDPTAPTEVEIELSLIINSSQVANDDIITLRYLFSDADAAPPATVLHTEPGTNTPDITVVKAAPAGRTTRNTDAIEHGVNHGTSFRMRR